MLKWRHSGGFSVNCDVGIDAEDRKGLERLIRYCARPPFADDQLTLTANDTIRYQLTKPSANGETQLLLSPNDFFDKLGLLIPPPRKHRHHYHGALAPNAPYRKYIVAYAGKPLPESMGELKTQKKSKRKKKTDQVQLTLRYLWCILLARVYELMPLQCPNCSGEMRIIAFIKDQSSIHSILNHLNEPTQAPQMMSARGPPEMMDEQLEIEFKDDFVDIPDDDFDQRISW